MLTRKRSQTLKWLAVAICVCSGPSALASDPPPRFADPQTWFDLEWDRADRDVPSDLIRFRWERTDDQPVPSDLLATLRASVQGRKDHPQYPQLMLLEATAAGNPPRGEWVLWRDGESFRVNNTTMAPAELVGGFCDYSVSSRGSWGLGPGALDLADAHNPEPGYNYRAWGNTVTNDLRLHLSCGWLEARALKLSRPTLTVSGTGWTAESQDPQTGASLTATGRWIAPEGRGEFGVLVVTLPADNGTALRFEADPAQWNDALGAWATPRLVWTRSEGASGFTPFRTTRLIDVGKITREEFERVTTVPKDGALDPVRGEVHLTVTRDGRSGFRHEVRLVDDQTVVTPLPANAAVHDYWWLRTTGWACLLLLTFALVLLRVRGRRGSC